MKIPKQGLTGEVLLREAVTEYRAIIDLLRSTLASRFYPTEPQRWIELSAVYADRVVVNTDKGHLFQFPYTISADNIVTLGEPIEVKGEYVPLKEAVQAIKAAVQSGETVFVEAVGEENSGKWLIRVIKAGISGNNNYYPDAALREAVPLFENARVYVKGDKEHLAGEGKDFKNLTGRLTDPKFIEGQSIDTGEITATLEFIEADGAVSKKVAGAFSRGMSGLFGFSIDAVAKAKKSTKNGVSVREATKITKVQSVDLIIEPGAGGQLIRMVEAAADDLETLTKTQSNPKEQDTMRVRMLEAIRKNSPAAFALIDPETIGDDQLEAAYREAIAKDGNTNLATTEQIRMVECRASMRVAISTCTLPQVAKDKLLNEFTMRESFKDDDVKSAIEQERAYLGSFTESGKPVINFDDGVRVTEGRAEKITDMLDAFFDPAHKDHREVGSFKECYVEITGDKRVTGEMKNIDKSRMREALGIDVRESLDTSSFADALGSAITRRMQAEYAGMTDLQAWRKVATPTSVSDFRTQERIRIGGYGNLPIVGERDPYASLSSPTDDKATYVVAKRGGTEDFTMEMVKNDDVGAIRRIPTELAMAAGNTLFEFVFDFFRLNPVGSDGVAIYHASHNNLFTVALSATEFAAHRVAMLKQTRAGSGKRTNVGPGLILVPFELQELAYNTFVRNQNLDKTFVQTINPEVVPVPYWTDATDWVTVANPQRGPVLEIGFLDGKEEPELFVQDSPTSGSMFNNDTITYKIRHIYGGESLVDAYKFTTKAVVAG